MLSLFHTKKEWCPDRLTLEALLLPIQVCLIYLCLLITDNKKVKFYDSLLSDIAFVYFIACFRVMYWFLFLF